MLTYLAQAFVLTLVYVVLTLAERRLFGSYDYRRGYQEGIAYENSRIEKCMEVIELNRTKHSPDCGTLYRGCSPKCPKYRYETWKQLCSES